MISRSRAKSITKQLLSCDLIVISYGKAGMKPVSRAVMSASGATRFRFGLFELDIRAGELRKEGRRIRLQEQPLQILTMLLQSPDSVVLREEIRNRLWSNETVVDFDHSINAAVKRLRNAL